MRNLIRRFAKDEKGATAIEYGLIATLISIAIIGGITLIGDEVGLAFNTIGTEVQENRIVVPANG